jgi:hypothetical protein
MPTQQCYDNTIGCDSRFRSNLTLADANPPGSWVNNTPFRHTSRQPGVPAAARPGIPPHRCQKRNQLVARLEHFCEPRDSLGDRTDSCDYRSPTVVTHYQKSHIVTNRDHATLRHLRQPRWSRTISVTTRQHNIASTPSWLPAVRCRPFDVSRFPCNYVLLVGPF